MTPGRESFLNRGVSGIDGKADQSPMTTLQSVSASQVNSSSINESLYFTFKKQSTQNSIFDAGLVSF